MYASIMVSADEVCSVNACLSQAKPHLKEPQNSVKNVAPSEKIHTKISNKFPVKIIIICVYEMFSGYKSVALVCAFWTNADEM